MYRWKLNAVFLGPLVQDAQTINHSNPHNSHNKDRDDNANYSGCINCVGDLTEGIVRRRWEQELWLARAERDGGCNRRDEPKQEMMQEGRTSFHCLDHFPTVVLVELL